MSEIGISEKVSVEKSRKWLKIVMKSENLRKTFFMGVVSG